MIFIYTLLTVVTIMALLVLLWVMGRVVGVSFAKGIKKEIFNTNTNKEKKEE